MASLGPNELKGWQFSAVYGQIFFRRFIGSLALDHHMVSSEVDQKDMEKQICCAKQIQGHHISIMSFQIINNKTDFFYI